MLTAILKLPLKALALIPLLFLTAVTALLDALQGVVRFAFRLFSLVMMASFLLCLWLAYAEGLIWYTPLLVVMLEMIAVAFVAGLDLLAGIPELLCGCLQRFLLS